MPLLPSGQFNVHKLRAALCDRFKCECIAVYERGSFVKSDGTPHAAVYAFVRTLEDEVLDAVVHIYNEDHPIMPHMLEQICRRLKIDDPRDVTHWNDSGTVS